MQGGQRCISPPVHVRRSSLLAQVVIHGRSSSEDVKPSTAALRQAAEEPEPRPLFRHSDALSSLLAASEQMEWPRRTESPPQSAYSPAAAILESISLPRPVDSPVMTTTSDEKRKRLPKLVIPETGESTSIDKVSLADALAMLSASVLDKSDLDVFELLKLGLEQHRIRASKRDRSQKSASSASASADPSPRSRPPLRKRMRQRVSSSKNDSPGGNSLSPPSGSTGATSASPLTPINSSKLRRELAKRESIDYAAKSL